MILTKTAWQTLRQTLRAELKPPDDWKALSSKSKKDYEQKFAHLNGRLPAQVAKCKRSYYTLRAAYLHGQSRLIRRKLNELDKFTRALDDSDKVAANQAVMAQIDSLGIHEAVAEYMLAKNAPAFNGSIVGVEQPSHGKRRIGLLPKGWKTRLVAYVPKDSIYRPHVAAMALCGCRPSEFEKGIVFKWMDSDTIALQIEGTKTGERTKDGKTYSTGQTRRTLMLRRGDTLDADGYPNTDFLMFERALAGQTQGLLKAKATALRDVVIRASKKAFPQLKNRPTAYSFRHAFASELKAANGADSVDTAAALGHASTKTQSCYGYGRSGRSGGVGCQASASDPIRSPRMTRESRLVKAVHRTAAKVSAPVAVSVPMPAPRPSKVPMPAPSLKLRPPRLNIYL